MSIALAPAAWARGTDEDHARPRERAAGTLRAANYAAADRLLGWLLLAHFPLALALAAWRGTWTSAVVAGGLTSAIAWGASRLAPGRPLTRFAVGVAFMCYSALLIHQSGGMIEMHFHVFASLAFLLTYRDWRVPVVAAIAIAVHHALFNALQASGVAGVTVFEHAHGWGIVLVHAAFVAFETAVLVQLARTLDAEATQSEALVAMARRLGAGDLAAPTGRALDRTGGVVGAAVGALADGTEAMRALIAGLRGQSTEVAELAGMVTAATTQVASAAGEVSAALDTVASGAQAQARDTHELATVVARTVDGVGRIAERVQSVARSSDVMAVVAEQGAAAVQRTVAGMSRIQDAVHASSRQIRELAAAGDEIGAAVTAIRRIAEQTNLLSLNAAIEAARAGQHGRGFSVVASEVRRLADQAERSAEQVGELLARVQGGMAAVVRGMEAESAQVNEGTQLAEAAGEALEQILVAVERTLGDLGGIGETANAMAVEQRTALATLAGAEDERAGRADAATSARALEALVRRSERSAAATEDASASLQEITAAMQEVEASAARLATIARGVEGTIGRFRV